VTILAQRCVAACGGLRRRALGPHGGWMPALPPCRSTAMDMTRKMRFHATIAGLCALSVLGGGASAKPLLLGAALPGGIDSTHNIASYEDKTGRHLDIAELPMPWANTNGYLSFGVALPWVRAVAAHDGLPMLTWEPEIGPSGAITKTEPLVEACPARLAAAAPTAPVIRYLTQYAKDVASYGKPVLLRPMHEMNIPGWYWSIGPSAGCGTIQDQDYVAAWRRIVGIFRDQRATNARFVWCINHINLNSATYTSAFPGDDYVQYVAIDGYNWGGKKWRGFDQIFAPAYRALGEISTRPILIAEWASAESGGDKAAWIADAFSRIAAGAYPRIAGLVWFDRAYPGQPPWPIDSSPAAATAYRGGAARLDAR
jgi:Glycosyl hydrolase family 26